MSHFLLEFSNDLRDAISLLSLVFLQLLSLWQPVCQVWSQFFVQFYDLVVIFVQEVIDVAEQEATKILVGSYIFIDFLPDRLDSHLNIADFFGDFVLKIFYFYGEISRSCRHIRFLPGIDLLHSCIITLNVFNHLQDIVFLRFDHFHSIITWLLCYQKYQRIIIISITKFS